MTFDDERPVGVTDLRRGVNQTTPTVPVPGSALRTSHAGPRPRHDPTMSEDIVARARASLAAANRPSEPEGAHGHLSSAVIEPHAGPPVGVERQPAPQESSTNDTTTKEADTDQTGTAPAPESAPTAWPGYDPDFVADRMVPAINARATRGWRARLGLRPSKAEQLHQQLTAAMCVNFGAPVKIVVANPRGSAGKTSLTLGLAGALGLARGGRVCAFEDHELRGTMALRTVANGTQRTTRDFINDMVGMTPEQVRHADLSRYVRHQIAGQFDAMVTSRNREKQLDGEEYRAGLALLERFYEVIVVDTANNEGHVAFQAAIDSATVLVVPIKWRPTHITPATQMLADMATASTRHRQLVENAVIVASNGANEVIPGSRETALPMFASLAHAVVEIPPDPHVEADRPIVHDQLRPATRTALDRLGAAVCEAAVENLREMGDM